MITRLALLASLLLAAACGGDDGDSRSISVDGERLWGARFSPDGARLAVAFGDDDKLGVIDLATGALTEVADNTSYLTGTAWAANGDIVYDGSGGVYRVTPGGAPVELTDAFASMNVDLSPDGTRLAYGVNGSDAELYTIATDTTTSLGVDCDAVRFSPVADEVACMTGSELVLVDLATLATTPVVTTGISFIAGVDWYADGQALVFTSDDGIERVTRAGARTRLADAFAAIELDLAPDDKSLVYLTNGSADLSLLTF